MTEHRQPQPFEPLRRGADGPHPADDPPEGGNPPWLDPQRLRRVVPVAVGILLVVGLVGLGAVGPLRDWVHGQPVYQWTIDNVEFDPEPPPWIRGGRAALLAEVRGNLERFEGTSALDLDLEAVTRAFKNLVWVERVQQVRINAPNRLVVTLEFRMPVAEASFQAREPTTADALRRDFIFDRSAILLPGNELDKTQLAAALIRVKGLEPPYNANPGAFWTNPPTGDEPAPLNPKAQAAARLAGFLAAKQQADGWPDSATGVRFQIDWIDPRGAPELPLWLVGGPHKTWIAWGAPPDDEPPGALTAEEKWTRLRAWLQHNDPSGVRYPRYLAFTSHGVQVEVGRTQSP